MGAGDTIPGEVRVRAQRNDGSEPRILGPLSQSRVDYHNRTVEQSDQLFINTGMTRLRSKPAGAASMTVEGAVFQAGEVMKVEHKESGSLAEAIDHDDGDAFEIEVVIVDLNTGTAYPRTLTAQDTDLSSNPTSSNSSWVSIFEYTVNDRQRLHLAGSFQAIATENA